MIHNDVRDSYTIVPASLLRDTTLTAAEVGVLCRCFDGQDIPPESLTEAARHWLARYNAP